MTTCATAGMSRRVQIAGDHTARHVVTRDRGYCTVAAEDTHTVGWARRHSPSALRRPCLQLPSAALASARHRRRVAPGLRACGFFFFGGRATIGHAAPPAPRGRAQAPVVVIESEARIREGPAGRPHLRGACPALILADRLQPARDTPPRHPPWPHRHAALRRCFAGNRRYGQVAGRGRTRPRVPHFSQKPRSTICYSSRSTGGSRHRSGTSPCPGGCGPHLPCSFAVTSPIRGAAGSDRRKALVALRSWRSGARRQAQPGGHVLAHHQEGSPRAGHHAANAPIGSPMGRAGKILLQRQPGLSSAHPGFAQRIVALGHRRIRPKSASTPYSAI